MTTSPYDDPAAGGLLRKVRLTLEMIKFEHTVFALPFALLGAILAARGWPTLGQLFWIVVACVFARSAAMSWNRLQDERFDRQNPRTENWPLPAGLLTRGFVWTFLVVCCIGFMLSAYMLNPLAFILSPVALAILFFYSLTKRFTSYTHLFLGLALGIAPIGAWIAIRGNLEWPPVLLGLGVMLWTAGFDMIYSLQDVAVDKRLGLNSLPVRLGERRALAVSALCHALAVLVFGSLVFITPLGAFYLLAVGMCAWLLVYEQTLVSPDDLARLPVAFFTLNGWVSILIFCGGLLDVAPGWTSFLLAFLILAVALLANYSLLAQIFRSAPEAPIAE